MEIVIKCSTNNTNNTDTDMHVKSEYELSENQQLQFSNTRHEQPIDIKSYNEFDKTILYMFINKYVGLINLTSIYNEYNDLITNSIKIFKQHNTPLLRGFANAVDILKHVDISKFDTKHNYMCLNVSVLPTFAEALLNMNMFESLSVAVDFIQTNSTKNKINKQLYDELLNNVKQKYPLINCHFSKKFYTTSINSNTNPNYDLIIFDTYKNFTKMTDDNITTAQMNSKHIYHQIVYGLNNLKNGGNMILLFGFGELDIYNEFHVILESLFENIIFVNSYFDFSLRYFVICNCYNYSQQFVYKLTTDYLDNFTDNLDKNKYLKTIGLKHNLQQQQQQQFKTLHDSLVDKFQNQIQSRIQMLRKFYSKPKFIKKIYHSNYHIQLMNSYKWATLCIATNNINQNVKTKLIQFKLKTELKQTNIHTKLIDFDLKYVKPISQQFTWIGQIINNDSFKQIFQCLKYNDFLNNIMLPKLETVPLTNNNLNIKQYKQLFGLVKFKHSEQTQINVCAYLEKQKEIKEFIDELNITDIAYIDIDYLLCSSELNFVDAIFGQQLNLNIVIKFKFDNICPLFLSVLYMLCYAYNFSVTIQQFNNSEYYLIGTIYDDFKNDLFYSELKQIKTNYKTNMLNPNLYLTTIDELFITKFTTIYYKIFINETISKIKTQYLQQYIF